MGQTGQTTAEPSTTEILRDLLQRAERAHGLHEKELGRRDDDWPQWYAEHMTRALSDAGEHISRDGTDAAPAAQRAPELAEQTVVVIGGSAGIGLETARRARAEGANVILTARDAERLQRAASDVGALRSAAFDATDGAALERFFRDLPAPIDHVMVTAGRPTYGRLADLDLAQVRRDVDQHIFLALEVARLAAGKVRPGGTLLFMGGTGARHPAVGLALASTVTAALPALTASLALELAPIRVNLIAAGFVDTPLSAALLGGELDDRRNQLRATLPIRRVVGPADVAALAVHLMVNTALTGATYDVDGGQQLVAG
jgi:NAD(P)-dependent dehydrogenase (short-subunit alcohol dehydrogenase family)